MLSSKHPWQATDAPLAMNVPHVTPPVAPRRRQRLPPAIRTQHILDAALHEFSTHGFIAARMDDIAARAGLSKGGLYAHFSSKDALFSALLQKSLSSRFSASAVPAEIPITPSFMANWLVNTTYDTLIADPAVPAIVRLMIAESLRAPQAVAQWREQILESDLAQIAAMLRRGAAQGHLRTSVAEANPWLLLSPAVHTVVAMLISGDALTRSLDECRDAHVRMLIEWLTPPSTTVPKPG